jgi:hypothetical protein
MCYMTHMVFDALRTLRASFLRNRVQLELKANMDNDTATLEWLVEALEQARSQGQTEIVDHLETIAADMVFEMEMAARRASLLSRVM